LFQPLHSNSLTPLSIIAKTVSNTEVDTAIQYKEWVSYGTENDFKMPDTVNLQELENVEINLNSTFEESKNQLKSLEKGNYIHQDS
jgi:hypothetical protein